MLNKYMWLSCLEALCGLLFGFRICSHVFGTVIFDSRGIGLFFAVICLGYFLNLANRIQEKYGEIRQTKQSFNSALVEMIKNTVHTLLKNFNNTHQREVY